MDSKIYKENVVLALMLFVVAVIVVQTFFSFGSYDPEVVEEVVEVKTFERSVEGLERASKNSVIENRGDLIRLSADIVKKEIDGKEIRMFGYNGMIPGPTLKVRQGQTLDVEFTNNLDIETTVHWHGLRVDNEFDGVPDVTQDPILPGESFLYKLKFPDDGVFWYHPHVREDYQQELGLYGNIIVQGSNYNVVNREELLVLDDVFLKDGDLYPFSESISHTLMGRFGNKMLVNGEENYVLNVMKNEIVRFYVTNVANTRVFKFSIDGIPMKLVGSDIGLFESESFVDDIVIASAERYIVEVLFEEAGEFEIKHSTPDKEYTLGKIIVSGEEVEGDLAREFFALDKSKVSFDVEEYYDVDPDIEITLTIERDIMGHGMDNKMNGMMGGMGEMTGMHSAQTNHDGIEWEDSMPMMNKMSDDGNVKWILRDKKTGLENMDLDYDWKVGEMVKIRLFNDPESDHPMHHPIHFHGQRFLVLEKDGFENGNLVWKDTVLVPMGSYVDILLEVSNPGDWMAHCHIAEHMHAGMMMVFEASI